MKKRVLAILCVLSILMGMVVMPAAAETTAAAQSDAPTTYDVGYAKVDISPLTDMDDDSTLIAVPMSGYGSSRERLATSIDEHIYSTCTAITDAEGNTVLYYTLDSISPPTNLVTDVRAAVVAALGEKGITADRIYINGSHSHEAPDFGSVKSAKTNYDNKNTDEKAADNTATFMAEVTKGLGLKESITENDYVELITQWSDYYWDTVIAGMTQAAADALKDRTPCTMSKGQIDAGNYTATQLSASSPFYNMPMNAVRHYKLTLTKTTTQQTRSLWGWTDGTSTTEVVSVNYRGDNFGAAVTVPETSYSTTSLLATSREKYTYALTEDNVNEADDNIYLIKFTPKDDDSKNPIVFANWRGHPSVNGGSDVKEVSSDYIDYFRSSLEAANLRPAFFLGTSGNINVRNTLTGKDWYTNITNSDDFERKNLQTQAYGKMLGQIALHGLTNNMSADLACGTIKTMQANYANTANKPAKGLYEVAKAAMDRGKYPSEQTIDGVRYVVENKYNATNIINRYESTSTIFSEEVNAILLGDSVAFVTAPNELFDYYNENMETGAGANKWFELNSENLLKKDTYGMPFIMAYTNGHNSYLPNKLAYAYENANGSTGSYESHSSTYAAGGGEALLDQYGKMLSALASGGITYKCQHCKKEVEWTPLFTGDANTDLTSGHYVMLDDLKGTGTLGQQELGKTDKVEVCLDLNGYTYYSESRCVYVYSGSIINIMNMPGVNADGEPVENKQSGSTGMMIGHSFSNNPGGGAFSVSAGATVNLYGGTLKFEKVENDSWYGTGIGGVMSLSGTLNMYGGTIMGADLVNSKYHDSKTGAYFSNNGCGGAVYVSNSGKMYVYSGTITAGSVPDTATTGTVTEPKTTIGRGRCVFMEGTETRVTLAGDAKVENIYYNTNGGACLNVSGTYTGNANLTFREDIPLAQNADIGNVETGADISNAKLTFTNDNKYKVAISGTNLVLRGYDDSTVAVIVDGTNENEYTSLGTAIANYSSNGKNYIKLIKTPDESAVTINKTVYLDLNGIDVGANITVNADLYVMDSQTDDYSVDATNHTGYGKLTGELKGNIKAVPVESDVAEDGYLMVEEDDIGTSFHRVNLQISAMTLRPRWEKQDAQGVYNPDVYYTCGFAADAIAAAKVTSYGVAMSVDGVPTADKLNSDNSSNYTGFTAGKDGNSGNGTLLTDVLKETNNPLVNRRNANLTVYGSAYIQMGENEYMFGACVEQSLRTLVAGGTIKIGGKEYQNDGINSERIWSDLDDATQQGFIEMYKKYKSMIDSWIAETDKPNLFEETMNSPENNALKILVVGNSHGLDATNLLYEVFEAQKQNGKYVTADGREYNEVVIGALYHSGATVAQHASWANNVDIQYSYSKIDSTVGTGKSWQYTTPDKTMYDALSDEPWDIVVMQTMNTNSALDNQFNTNQFTTVINYINSTVKYDNGSLVNPKLAWHMVWSNPDGNEYLGGDASLSHPNNAAGWKTNHTNYFPSAADATVYDQSVMYDEIVRCLKRYISDANGNSFLGGKTFDYILPSAVAVEYAQDVLGCTQAQIYRDYTHMNDYGRLMVAYVWWAKLMGYDSIGANIIGEIPKALHHSNSKILDINSAGNYVVTDDMKKIIRKAVNYALENPNDYAMPAEDDNTVSILGIGNSYTIDSMWMLGEVYQAENRGKTVQLGIAYKSGESLAGHVTNINAVDDNAKVYDYLYWDSTSDKWTVSSEKMSLDQILDQQAWEMVSMQQGSTGSGVPSTYNSDIEYIQNHVIGRLGYTPTFLWNMTWAYPEVDIQGDKYTLEDAPNAWSFKNYYGSSQATMYKAIMSTVQEKILPNATFDYLMPVGTAIQNANGTLTDHELYRDYTHLSDLSRLMAAYTWYCELEHATLDTLQLKALPTVNCSSSSWYNGAAGDLTAQELSLVINSVKDAMKYNFTTTDASVYN